jgi:hypothetical protein
MSDQANSDPRREMLRHTLATLAYRGGKAVRNAPDNFAEFRGCDGMRTPGQILAHIGDLLDWAWSLAVGKQDWHDSKSLPWEKEIERFFAALKKLDDSLAAGASAGAPLERMFQGPVADALTHVGQISLLRRMAGNPVKGENYFAAEIKVGRVGADQAAPKRGF